MEPRYKVVVGRKWNNPQIYTEVTDEHIQMSINLHDYLTALIKELGSPAMVFSKKELEARIQAASAKVIEEVKKASREVV